MHGQPPFAVQTRQELFNEATLAESCLPQQKLQPQLRAIGGAAPEGEHSSKDLISPGEGEEAMVKKIDE
jgi:hypothetical protein